MDTKETGLCIFCSELIKATNNTPAYPSQRPHYETTYGLLLSSSKTCTACQLIASLWGQISPTLIRHGLSYETFEKNHGSYPVEITMKENRRMQSGLRWAFFQAGVESPDAAFTFMSYFTITACLSGGNAIPISSR